MTANASSLDMVNNCLTIGGCGIDCYGVPVPWCSWVGDCTMSFCLSDSKQWCVIGWNLVSGGLWLLALWLLDFALEGCT